MIDAIGLFCLFVGGVLTVASFWHHGLQHFGFILVIMAWLLSPRRSWRKRRERRIIDKQAEQMFGKVPR